MTTQFRLKPTRGTEPHAVEVTVLRNAEGHTIYYYDGRKYRCLIATFERDYEQSEKTK